MEFSTSYPSILSPSGGSSALSTEPSSSSTVSHSVKKWASVPVLTEQQARLQLVEFDLLDDSQDRPPRDLSFLNRESPPSPPASPVHSSRRRRPHELPSSAVVDTNSVLPNHPLEHNSEEEQFLQQNNSYNDQYSSSEMDDNSRKNSRKNSRPSLSSSPVILDDSAMCDLLCEIDGKDNCEGDLDIMTTSFDDNGNLVDEEEQQKQAEEDIETMEEDLHGGRPSESGREHRFPSNSEEPSSRKASIEENNMSDSTGKPKFQLGFKSHLEHSVEGFLEEPKYFINAAALSEDLDTFTMPSLESIGTLEECELATTKNHNYGQGRNYSKENNKESVTPTNAPSESITTTTTSRENTVPTVAVKPRVPMSKSFPDIIQTTFVDDCRDFKEKKTFKHEPVTEKDASINDLTADSLEDLPTKAAAADALNQQNYHYHRHHYSQYHQQQQLLQQQQTAEGLQFDLKGESNLQDIMSMSQSQSQIGILAEKPPEAWVIDLNSLSLDSEAFENSEMSSSSIKSSNPSSLAYFIDIDEKASDASNKRAQGGSKSPEKKKIFSMFVDFGEAERSSKSGQIQQMQQQQQQIGTTAGAEEYQKGRGDGYNRHSSMKPSRLPVHRNVMNVLKEGEPMSLISSHSSDKGSSSASSYISGGSSYKKRAFQYPSPISQHKTTVHQASRKAAAKIELLEATEKAKEAREVTLPPSLEQTMEVSNTSNRSSLHVATEFDMTFSSSFISSMETSGPEAEELCSKGPCFKLGKDLLRMFQDGINTDVKISVNGRILRAHKCILSSRSQYFAAIFSGQLLEKAGNTIELDGFSYTVVQFAMCHIYSGTNEIPDSIDLLELATLTDLLGLEGLRENISQTIRVKFCHNFHRPCTGCISGVLECLPIALTYEMDELHRKMTKWICKHFVRIWPTKAFANLGEELIDKCLRYSVNHLSVDNILDITLGCDQLLTTMPTVRWTEPIFAVVNQLTKACVQFIGDNFSQVLQSQRFLLFGKGQQWNISRIEGTFVESMSLLKPDEACLSHTALSRLIELGTETIDEVEWSTMFVDFLRMLAKEVERYLIANGSKAVLSKYWESLGKDVQKRICQSSFLGYDKAGNKIVKGSTPAMTAKQANQGRLTPSERSSSIASTRSALSSTVKHGGAGRAQQETKGFGGQSSNNASTAKIASVRPIQNVFSTAVSDNTAQSSTMPKAGSGHHARNRPQPTQLNRRKTEEKEKSFSNSPRNSVASSSIASANRTPMNPLTPMTPNKPGLGLLGSTAAATTTTTTGATTTAKSSSRPSAVRNSNAPKPAEIQQPPSTAKPGFITNSARASLVSKPNLRQRNVSSTSTTRTTTPRTPNLSQPSRYASSLGITSTRSTNYRNSQGSGSDRSERNSVTGTPSDSVKGVVPVGRTSRANTISSGTSRDGTTRERSSVNKNNSASGSSSSSSRKTSARTRTAGSASSTSSGHTVVMTTTMAPDPMRESIMSKSTIEMESGETKIRTLAEIGRSSTFSKDEPTILGKLDPNQTVNIDF